MYPEISYQLFVEIQNTLSDIMENSERSGEQLRIINDRLEEETVRQAQEIEEWKEKIRVLEEKEAEEKARDPERHPGSGN